MGNQLVGIAPSQIYPVEHYIQDLTDQHKLSLRFQASLGSTRFLKVARCESDMGPVVVKVFVIHDPSNDIKSLERRLRELKDSLSPTFNCLPFSHALLTEKAGFIIRQFGKYSLYDRISTRPFLSHLEKRWLAFQLLLPGTITVRDAFDAGNVTAEEGKTVVEEGTLKNLTRIRTVAVPILMNGNYRRCECDEGHTKESNFVVTKPVAGEPTLFIPNHFKEE